MFLAGLLLRCGLQHQKHTSLLSGSSSSLAVLSFWRQTLVAAAVASCLCRHFRWAVEGDKLHLAARRVRCTWASSTGCWLWVSVSLGMWITSGPWVVCAPEPPRDAQGKWKRLQIRWRSGKRCLAIFSWSLSPYSSCHMYFSKVTCHHLEPLTAHDFKGVAPVLFCIHLSSLKKQQWFFEVEVMGSHTWMKSFEILLEPNGSF